MNMVSASTYTAGSGRFAVSPVDSPTVANPETTSNSTSSIGAFVIWPIVIVEIAQIVAREQQLREEIDKIVAEIEGDNGNV